MRAFRCPNCQAALFFENSVCISCGSAVAYDRSAGAMVLAGTRTMCANLNLNGCNWLADPSSARRFCVSCQLTRTRPADSDTAGMADYYVAEAAKRRLVFGLDELGLPVKVSDGYVGLAFDLLSSEQAPVVTGYRNGVITVDLAEARDAHRERLRVSMAEPYRTLLGHLRHEVGHYYGELLVLTTARRSAFRQLFGDERAPYDDALRRHYASGPVLGWEQDYISAYATMHPLEDFAEVFAHFLHITDTLQTAAEYGLQVTPSDLERPFSDVLVKGWLPLTIGLNQINRSMGKPDLYPFLLSPRVIEKLEFVAEVVAAASRSG